jgi:carbonic anhydrase
MHRFDRLVRFLLPVSLTVFVLCAPHRAIASPDGSLQALQEGNARFASGQMTHPRCDPKARMDAADAAQTPLATVLCCSDSRLSPEIIFDAGLGDLFVIRVAGNVCGPDEVASAELGTDQLQTPLLVVLGHTDCGAVKVVATEAELTGNIPTLAERIRPAVQATAAAHPGLKGKGLLPDAIKANVFQSIADLLDASPVVRDRVKNGELRVVGAVYSLGTGKIEWLGPHPDQAAHLSGTVPTAGAKSK